MRHFKQGDRIPGFEPYRKTALAYAVQIHDPFTVTTLEGVMTAKAGAFLMKGPAGELYPCDEDIFNKTYVPADDAAPDGMFIDNLRCLIERIEMLSPGNRVVFEGEMILPFLRQSLELLDQYVLPVPDEEDGQTELPLH